MDNKNVNYILNGYIILLILVLIVLWTSPAEGFCNCSGLQATQKCVNPAIYPKDSTNEPPLGPQYLKKIYADDKMTEFTIPPKAGPSLRSPMPYDQFANHYAEN